MKNDCGAELVNPISVNKLITKLQVTNSAYTYYAYYFLLYQTSLGM